MSTTPTPGSWGRLGRSETVPLSIYKFPHHGHNGNVQNLVHHTLKSHTLSFLLLRLPHIVPIVGGGSTEVIMPWLSSWSSCLKITANKEDGIISIGHSLKKYLAWSWNGITPVHNFTAFWPSKIRTWPGAGLHEAFFLSAFFSKRLTDATNCWNLFFFLVTSTWHFQDLLMEQNWTHCGS